MESKNAEKIEFFINQNKNIYSLNMKSSNMEIIFSFSFDEIVPNEHYRKDVKECRIIVSSKKDKDRLLSILFKIEDKIINSPKRNDLLDFIFTFLCVYVDESLTPQSIYFLLNSEGHIKIGKAIDPESRIRNLEKIYGPLKIIKILDSCGKLESKIHKKFSKLRYKYYPKDMDGYTEWFSLDKELLEFIDLVNEKNITQLI